MKKILQIKIVHSVFNSTKWKIGIIRYFFCLEKASSLGKLQVAAQVLKILIQCRRLFIDAIL